MVDVNEVEYFAILLTSSGTQYDVTDYIKDLGWEEAKGEIATKSTFTIRNENTEFGWVSKMAKPGCILVILASISGMTKETSRGNIEVWNPTVTGSAQEIKLTCYDSLYPLSKSEINRTLKNKQKGKKFIKKLLKKWKVPVGKLEGPTVKLSKMVFEKETISKVITKVLDESFAKGDEKYIMRSVAGKFNIVEYGDNDDIYYFDSSNSVNLNEKQSTKDLITRVQIYDSENQKKKKTIKGKTKYGIRNKIQTMKNEQSLKDAKKEAKQLLKEKGVIEKSLTLKAPDIPFLRRGDTVFVAILCTNGYYDVQGVSHDADSRTMSLTLEYSDAFGQGVKGSKKFKKGQYVSFIGGTYHKSYKKKSGTSSANEGRCKITKVHKGGKYPYKVVHTSNSSNIRGWVDSSQIY